MVNDTLTRIEKGEFFLIAGPCVAESEQLCDEIADHVGKLAKRHNIPYVFKASYRKANRLAGTSYTGPGIEQGLAILAHVKEKHGLAILTDIHETGEIDAASRVADILQIPAFLCRQTDLVVRAAATGKWINIKKGQFLAPEDMSTIAVKAASRKVMLTERGTTFGYRNLIVDFRSLLIMKQTGLPVVFDATHSLQLPGAASGVSSGQPQYIVPMARAAAAVGIDGLFVETHPDPARALSDAGAMLPLSKMETLVESVLAIRKALR